MPRVWEEKGYKFYIYLNESKFEPAHIHVLSTEREMKVWLNDDLDIAECYDIPYHEWSKILKIINKQQEFFIKKYYEFNKQSFKS